MTISNTSTWQSIRFPHVRFIVALCSLIIALVLFIWALSQYEPAPNFYGPRAIYSLILLSLLLALLGRLLLLRLLRVETAETAPLRHRLLKTWRPLFLLDLTAPLYLAAGVLIDIPAAVITVLITQTVLQGYTALRGFVSWAEACYRLASSTLLVLIADSIYVWIAGSSHNYFTSPFYQFEETKELLGSIAAATVMLLLITLVSLPILIRAHLSDQKDTPPPWHTILSTAWQDYLHSPVLRFQALVLSVGPLIPIVDIFDNATAELAWIFFLVPLFAIYYLALNSTQLSIRTSTLQSTLQDLSSTRRRRDELLDYASLVTRVQEEERHRLARELHDDTAQALIALSLGLDGLGRAIGKLNLPEKDIQWLSDLQDLADSTLEGVRRACRDLRPSVLDDLGLRTALEWLSDSSHTRGVPCTFSCKGLPLVTPPEAEIAIFRIVQEALSNIWRHSQATKAAIDLHYLPGLLHLLVADNGKGFSVDSYSASSEANFRAGLGLLGMRERATLIGATLTITSSPAQGCTILLSLSL